MLNILLLALVAGPFGPDLYPDSVSAIDGSGAISGSYGGTCPDGATMILSVDGLMGCPLGTDVAPGDFIIHGVDNYAGGTQAAADLILRGGIDEKIVTIDDYTACAGATVTVTIDGSSTVLTEGVEWDDATGDNETATSLAAAVDALTGVSSVSAAAVVQITPDLTTQSISLAESVEACTTVAAGTDGLVSVTSNMSMNDNDIVDIGRAGVGTSAPAAGVHVLSLETNSAPTVFDSDFLVVGREPASGASSGAFFAFYNTTANEAIIGALAPASSWRPLTLISSAYTWQNTGGNDAIKFTGTGTLELLGGGILNTKTTTVVATSLTTFAITTDFVALSGADAPNTIATITGGVEGETVKFLFSDTSIVITDTAGHTADTVDLSAAFTSADDTVLTLLYDGTSWYETSRSVN